MAVTTGFPAMLPSPRATMMPSVLPTIIVVSHTLLVLNNGNDLDLLSFLAQNRSDEYNVGSFADETRRDKVNAMFHAKINQIVYVILGEFWKIDDSSWQI